MTHAHFNDEDSNTSLNPAFEGVLKARLSRRGLLRGGAALGGAAALGGCASVGPAAPVGSLGFTPWPRPRPTASPCPRATPHA